MQLQHKIGTRSSHASVFTNTQLVNEHRINLIKVS